MSLISAALSLFALLVMLAQVRGRRAVAAWIVGLAIGLWLVPEPARVAVPLGAILALAFADSVAGLGPQSSRN